MRIIPTPLRQGGANPTPQPVTIIQQGGGVSSISLTMPVEYSVVGTSDILVGWQSQSASLVLRSGDSGGVPGFSALTATDIQGLSPTFVAVNVSGLTASLAVGTDGSSNLVSLTDTVLTTHINVFSSTLKGAVPASGGGTTNFLRADGTFAAPPGATSGTVTSVATGTGLTGGTITSTGTVAMIAHTNLPAAATLGKIPYDNGTDYAASNAIGANQIHFADASQVPTGSSALIWNNSSSFLGVGGNPSTYLHVTDNSSTPNSASFVAGRQAVFVTSTSFPEFVSYCASASSTTRGLIVGERARGTLASPTAVSSGDEIFTIVGAGYDGTATFVGASSLRFVCDGTVSTSTVPIAMAFGTGSAASVTERGRIGSSGDWLLTPNSATATNATSGFVGLPTCAGIPTGSWAGYTGATAFIADSTNKLLWQNAGTTNWYPVGNIRHTITVTLGTNYTILGSDDVILINTTAVAGKTLTLPAANSVPAGKVITVKTVANGNGVVLTVSRAGSDTIDGGTSVTVTTALQSYTFVSDGSANWYIVAKI